MDYAHIRPVYNLYEMIFCQPYISIFAGIPYFAMGRYLSKHREIQPVFSKVIMFLALFLAEVFLVAHYNTGKPINHYLLLGPCAFVMFAMLRSIRIKLNHARMLRGASTIFYLSQFIWIFVMEFIEWFLKITLTQTEKFIGVAILCYMTYILITVLEKTEKLKWVRYLK